MNEMTPGPKTRASCAQSSKLPKGTRVVQPAPGRPNREEQQRLQRRQRHQGGTNGNDIRGDSDGGGGSSGSRADTGRRQDDGIDGDGGDGDGRHSLPVEHDSVHDLIGQAE